MDNCSYSQHFLGKMSNPSMIKDEFEYVGFSPYKLIFRFVVSQNRKPVRLQGKENEGVFFSYFSFTVALYRKFPCCSLSLPSSSNAPGGFIDKHKAPPTGMCNMDPCCHAPLPKPLPLLVSSQDHSSLKQLETAEPSFARGRAVVAFG